MSKTYDDLNGAREDGADPKRDKPAPADMPEPMDLFALAAARQASEPVPADEPAPEEEPVLDPTAPEAIGAIPVEELLAEPVDEPAPVVEESSSPYEEGPLFKRGVNSRRPLSGVIDPLAGTGGRRRGKDRTRLIIAVLCIAGAVAAGLFVILRGRASAEYASDATAVEDAVRTQKPAAPVSVSMPDPPPPQQKKKPVAPARFEDLTLNIPGALVREEGGVKIITFNAGLFTGGARLGRDGRNAIDAIAKQLSAYGGKLSITVIGCTDNTPMNAGSRYRDNEELGLDRSRAVIERLQETGNFPIDVFIPLSYGEKWSPYPNDTRANRIKNRTAVLRISCPSC